ncbi:MAG TPA: hypothetical protein PK379_10140 [Candidatus Hydrogenedentes bacterium]|nr:hypothetical protein [Candidatus Hydrogenedentota bacterium]HOK90373.1 hypothetical protein [Candidatus Hydrogenedentota bacterium]
MRESDQAAFSPINPGRAEMIKTYHFQGYLRPTDEIPDPMDCFNRGRELILQWMAEKYPDPLPRQMMEGHPWRVEDNGQIIATETLARRYWALRNEMPDSGIGDHVRPVAGRQWITEVVLGRENTDELRFSITVYCRNLPMAREQEIHLLRPRIVGDLAATGMLWTDNRQVRLTPWHVTTRKDVEDLFAFAVSPDRKMPLVICGERKNPLVTTGFNHNEFAKNIAGVAHWAVLDHEQMAAWNLKAGSWARIEPGWVWVYYSGFQPDQPREKNRHRLFQQTTDEFFTFSDYRGKTQGPEAFQRYLKKLLFTDARRSAMDQAFVRSFAEIRKARKDNEKDTDSSNEGILDLYKDEIDELTSENKELKERLRYLEQENARLETTHREEIGRLKQEIAGLSGRITSLRVAIKDTPLREDDPLPADEDCTWDNLASWVDTELAGRLILHNRARGMLKDAEYENVRLAYEALVALAGPYREMKKGDKKARKEWTDTLTRLCLDYDPKSLDPSRRGESYANEYELEYKGKKIRLEEHLKKGNSMDRRHCFRVYFFFDEEEQLVVVGAMPHHLTTRAS